MSASLRIFADHVDEYRARGFWPRPVIVGDKRPPMNQWERSDPAIDPAELASWKRKYARLGIGLVQGSTFPDGSRLGALDIDEEQYVPLARAMLFNPVCARVGARGLAFFVRVTAETSKRVFELKTRSGTTIHVGELLVGSTFCVIPPTIHPNGNAYRWLGPSLLDVEYSDLPLIED